jgi:type III pantothenate kinase
VEKLVLDQPKYLLIDIGNSRIKFARVDSADEELHIDYCVSVDALEDIIRQSNKVLVASVGKVALVESINGICLKYQVACDLVHTQQQQFGISCAYQKFENLGVDRWLAILAARTITELPVAVLDLGTANTCDIIIGKAHVGGWIAPGFSVMKQSLLANTQKVFADLSRPQQLTVGQSTPDCVNQGCLAALQGFVSMAENYLQDHSQNYEIFVTGGDQELLFSQKNMHLRFFPNLVLLGLQRFL